MQLRKTNERCRVQPPPPCTFQPHFWPPFSHRLNTVYPPIKHHSPPPCSCTHSHTLTTRPMSSHAPTKKRPKSSPKIHPTPHVYPSFPHIIALHPPSSPSFAHFPPYSRLFSLSLLQLPTTPPSHPQNAQIKQRTPHATSRTAKKKRREQPPQPPSPAIYFDLFSLPVQPASTSHRSIFTPN